MVVINYIIIKIVLKSEQEEQSNNPHKRVTWNTYATASVFYGLRNCSLTLFSTHNTQLVQTLKNAETRMAITAEAYRQQHLFFDGGRSAKLEFEFLIAQFHNPLRDLESHSHQEISTLKEHSSRCH